MSEGYIKRIIDNGDFRKIMCNIRRDIGDACLGCKGASNEECYEQKEKGYNRFEQTVFNKTVFHARGLEVQEVFFGLWLIAKENSRLTNVSQFQRELGYIEAIEPNISSQDKREPRISWRSANRLIRKTQILMKRINKSTKLTGNINVCIYPFGACQEQYVIAFREMDRLPIGKVKAFTIKNLTAEKVIQLISSNTKLQYLERLYIDMESLNTLKEETGFFITGLSTTNRKDASEFMTSFFLKMNTQQKKGNIDGWLQEYVFRNNRYKLSSWNQNEVFYTLLRHALKKRKKSG